MNGKLVILGIFVLLAGGFLALYSVTHTQDVYGVTLITGLESPYRNIGVVLLVFGIIGLGLGFIWPSGSESS